MEARNWWIWEMFCGAVERADGWSGCEEVWEKAGITDGSRFLACYHVGGGPFPKQGKLGEDQVGTVLAVPGLTAQHPWFQARKTEAPAFPVGTTGKNVEQTGPEEGARGNRTGQEPRAQNNSDSSSTMPSTGLHRRPVRFSPCARPFSVPPLRPSHPRRLLYVPSE